MSPKTRSTSVTIGLKWAPEIEPKARINAIRAPAVAAAFSSSCSPTSSGERRLAMIPEPTTAMIRKALPTSSASSRRPSGIAGRPVPTSGASEAVVTRGSAAGLLGLRASGYAALPLRNEVRRICVDRVELPRVLRAVDPHLVLDGVATGHVLL